MNTTKLTKKQDLEKAVNELKILHWAKRRPARKVIQDNMEKMRCSMAVIDKKYFDPNVLHTLEIPSNQRGNLKKFKGQKVYFLFNRICRHSNIYRSASGQLRGNFKERIEFYICPV